MRKIVITITEKDNGQKTTDIDTTGWDLMEQIVEIDRVLHNRFSELFKDYSKMKIKSLKKWQQ